MSKYKAILQELVGTAYNIPDGELSELLTKPDEELTDDDVRNLAETFKGKHRTVISSINITNNKALDEKFKAGERKKAQEFEKALKEHFAVDSDKQGPELIEDIVQQINSKPDNKGKQLTDDDIKKTPAFIRAEAEYKKQIEALKQEKEQSIKDLEANYQRKEVFGELSKEALVKIDSLNPVLSEVPEKAAAQKQIVIDKLSVYDWQKMDGKFVAFHKDGDKAGQRVENDMGHVLELDDLVKNTTLSYFDVRVAEPRKAPNGHVTPPNGTQPKPSYNGKMPKTDAEWRALQEDPNIPIADKMAINKVWTEQQPA